MKTKPFLLATAGSTVDGRTIDANMLQEMADSYNPQTYGARLNIEHIRGISGDGPFRAFGDVVELSVGEVDVQFGEETEKRTALYGVFDVTEDAKALNDAGQKVYSSIEIEPNFGGKGKAYLMGCALTDSPASIATERLKFNCLRPGAMNLSRDEGGVLAFADAAADPEAGDDFTKGFGSMLDSVFSKFMPKQADVQAPAADVQAPAAGAAQDEQPATFNVADLQPLLEGMGDQFSKALGDFRTEMREANDQIALKVKKLEDQAEATPAQHHTQRPQSGAKAGGFAGF